MLANVIQDITKTRMNINIARFTQSPLVKNNQNQTDESATFFVVVPSVTYK
jgi:hypothetical protein